MFTAYESAEELSAYLHFHYADRPDSLAAQFGMERFGNFHARFVERFLAPPAPGNGQARALDLGCGVGRAAFELSRSFDEVVGIDFSASFASAAERLRLEGSLPVELIVRGAEKLRTAVTLPSGSRPERVRFEKGDACGEGPWAGVYDCVLAMNLICRVPAPRRLLHRFRDLVRPGGQLLLSTPFSWSADYTAPDEWLHGDPATALERELSPHFARRDAAEIPFLIRETERKHQWCVAYGSAWERL
jgi:putative 4-mercaptohistidine N1-methyltranferase